MKACYKLCGMTGKTSKTRRIVETGSGRPLTSLDVLEDLEARLLSAEWRVGQGLPSERKLAEQLSISRPVVREVLRRLQERGLVTVIPGRGSFVRDVRPTDGNSTADLLSRTGRITARDLVVARAMLECETARLAAQNRTETDIRRMQQILAAFNASEDVGVSAELDVAFHESIAIASGNPVLQLMFGSLRNLARGIILRSLTDRKVRKIGAPYHEVILEAIIQRDADAARTGMAEHITAAQRLYGADFDQPLAEVLSRRADLRPRVAELLRQASLAIGNIHPGGANDP
jgi:GntR family transcriptional repressor for pyruvate dehydrogenase complex